ncbi:MAG: right-handed parallel beta-helix repeat-containing protein [Planctomycetes bacterium]|nr:right-handed parallel beta-helix repeat-containing protein [Planctomycetota bacterium]
MKKKHFYAAVILLAFLAAGIQPAYAVISLTPTGWKDDTGDDPGVGTWDLGTLTGTLTQNVDEPIEIKGDELTLDGNGYTLTELLPSAQGYGVLINNQNGITVRNLNITGVDIGIWISNSNPGPAEPKQNTIENNTIYGTTQEGIEVYLAYATVIRNNNFLDNWISIYIENAGKEDVFGDGYDFGNTITGNTLTNNAGGIYLVDGSYYNNVVGNTVTGDSDSANGFYLFNSHNNTLTGNTSTGNNFGIRLNNSSSNTIYNNNFIDNATQADVLGTSTGNVFNLDAPTGGNHWSDWTGPDDDNDGFVDEPYVISTTLDVKDEFPWTDSDGWEIEPPEPAESIEDIIAVLEDMDVPEDAEKEMDKAVKELNKAIDEFNNDRIDKALNNIAKAVKQLMKAQEEGADTQGVIDELVDLVKGIADKAIEDAIEAVGTDNLHVVKAQEHYDKADGNLTDGKYDAAIKKFKNVYKEAMKALGE